MRPQEHEGESAVQQLEQAEPQVEQAVEAAMHGDGGAFNPGDTIMHHILDQPNVEIPFFGVTPDFPHWELFGIDVSLSRNVIMMWMASAVLLTLVFLAVRRVREPVPRGLRSVFEVLVLFIRDNVARQVIDKQPDRYVPFLLTTFFFILSMNMFGLVPGMSTATGAISVTAALAGVAFVMIQTAGIREYGVVQHFKNLVPHGLPVILVPLMLLIEVISMFARPFALCIRLMANMTAGHVVIISLISLIFVFKTAWAATVSVPFVLFIYLLELLVAFIQAFIFTMLTALFIGMSAHPAH